MGGACSKRKSRNEASKTEITTNQEYDFGDDFRFATGPGEFFFGPTFNLETFWANFYLVVYGNPNPNPFKRKKGNSKRVLCTGSNVCFLIKKHEHYHHATKRCTPNLV